jgi:hypothetical protein
MDIIYEAKWTGFGRPVKYESECLSQIGGLPVDPEVDTMKTGSFFDSSQVSLKGYFSTFSSTRNVSKSGIAKILNPSTPG